MMTIEAPALTGSSGATRMTIAAPPPSVATTTSAVLTSPPRAVLERDVSYVSTIPTASTAPPAPIERIEQPPVVEPVYRPVIAGPTSVDQPPAAGSDPAQIQLAATAVATSMLAPPPFGPSIIIPNPDTTTVTTTATTPATASNAAAANPQSLYALFQTAIVGNGAAPAGSGVRRTMADIMPKPEAPTPSAPVA